MGYGIIHVEGKNMHLLAMGCIDLTKYDTHETKLKKIFERVSGLIKEFLPDQLAIEAPFYGKNVQSMLKLGRAQGVAIAACLAQNIPYEEFAPKRIKQSVTGNGNASKESVAYMLKSMFKLKEIPKNLDATDGLAAAVTFHLSGGQEKAGKSYSGWSSFVSANKEKIKR